RLRAHRKRWSGQPERRGRTGAPGHRGGRDRRHEHHGRPRHGTGDPAGGLARRHGHQRGDPAGLAERAHAAVRRCVHPRGGGRRPGASAAEGGAVTAAESTTNARERARLAQLLEYLLTERAVLLAVLLVGVLVWFKVLEAGQYLVAPYDLGYLASALESLVP